MPALPADRIGLIIPTLDAGPYLDRLEPALRAQSLQPARFVVIDSQSTDGTVARFQALGAEVRIIDRATFDHGRTRQEAVETLGDVDIVVFLTQDAVPAHPDALRILVDAFRDPTVGAAYGRQRPDPAATPIAAHARLFNYPATSGNRCLADTARLGIKTAFCSNSFAAYRRHTLIDVGGFPDRAIHGEDMLAVAAMLAAGWHVRYVAKAEVYHSHNYTIGEDFRRYFDIGVLHGSHPGLLARFGAPEGEGLRFLRSELSYLRRTAPRLIPSALARTGAKYLGYRLGRNERSLPTALKRRVCMNRGYWR